MTSGTQKTVPKLSGPHICFGVGQQTLEYVKKTLAAAAEHKGGGLTADEISFIVDMAECSEELFEIFRSNYQTCGKLHKKQPFVAASDTFFTTSVLRFLCFDVLRSVFQTQIRFSDPDWEVTFLGGLSSYINDFIDPGFSGDLVARYKDLTRKCGMQLDVLTIAQDDEVIRKVRNVVASLSVDERDIDQIVKTINGVLSEKYNDYGASPIKISKPVVWKFIEDLKSPENANFFRKNILLEN